LILAVSFTGLFSAEDDYSVSRGLVQRGKILLAALTLLILVSLVLTLTNVSRGDAGGGGLQGMISILLL
jgi:hypothetical protein